MADLFTVVDASGEVFDFIEAHFPAAVTAKRIPKEHDFNSPLVLISTSGAGPMRHKIFDPTLVTIDVIHKSGQTASELARNIHALMMNWGEMQDNVLSVESQTRPFDYPHTQTQNPTYTFTLSVTFSAEHSES